MRYSFKACLFTSGALLVLAAFTAGCGCDQGATCLAAKAFAVATGGGGTVCPEDPVDGDVPEECGIWASSSRGDDANPGTQDAPVKTLGRALKLAQDEGGPMRVYACGEVFPETVEVEGASMFGGFDCEHGWTWVGGERRAKIDGPAALATMTLLESERLALFGDLEIVATDAITPGASAIAVFARAGAQARFRRVDVVAGRGADGADGEDGDHNGASAPQGPGGVDGADACTGDLGPGGVAAKASCGDGEESISGEGGDGGEFAAMDGLDGLQLPDPNPQNKGVGGKGESAAPAVLCTAGLSGAHGQDGQNAFGGTGPGELTSAGFVGARGGDGQPGASGQGGGGGGGALGFKCAGPLFGGAGGGSGGAGGCGGKGGKGGQGGGSSIGFALLSQRIYAEDVRITTGDGGNGGHGGFLQPGGQGGLPGYGGLGVGGADGPKSACAGGVGGKGGNGGNGGGGGGGHSAGVLHPPFITFWVSEPVSFVYGQAGAGGVGGDARSNAQTGAKGIRAHDVTVDGP